MRLAKHLTLFGNEFHKFNNTGIRMIDSIYHMTFKLLLNRNISVKKLRFCHNVFKVSMDVITYKICKPLVVYMASYRRDVIR